MQTKAAVHFALIHATIGLRAEAQGIDAGRVTLQRIFASRDFVGQRFGPARWLASGDAYTTIELAVGGGADIVRYDAATGARSVVVPAARLVPSGSSEPIDVEDYAWSPDGKALLGFTNPHRLLAARRRGREGLSVDRRHRFSLLVPPSRSVPEGGNHQFRGACRRRQRHRRRDEVASHTRRSAQYLYRENGMGRPIVRSGC